MMFFAINYFEGNHLLINKLNNMKEFYTVNITL
jgi:hypothetical protein